MRIIHCADIHLGSPLRDQRRDEIKQTFDRMVKWGNDNDVRVIIISGDLFDSCNVPSSVISGFLDTVSRYNNIDFVVEAGNHDGNIDFRKYGSTENLKVFASTDSYRYGKVLITRTDSARAIRNIKFNRDDVNIVIFHGMVNESDFPAGHGIDYVALGHIHKFMDIPIDERGHACYSGCLEPRGFDEIGRKGFVILETNPSGMPKVRYKFMGISKRTVWDLKIDISRCKTNWEIYQLILENAKNAHTGDLAYIYFRGLDNTDRGLDLGYMKKTLEQNFFDVRFECADVKKERTVIRTKGRLRAEFERLIMEQDILAEEKQDIYETGLAALSGEDILN